MHLVDKVGPGAPLYHCTPYRPPYTVVPPYRQIPLRGPRATSGGNKGRFVGTGGRQALEGNYNCNYPNKEANNRRRFTPCRPHNGMVFVPRPFIPTFLFAASETSNLVKPTSFPSCQSSGSNLIQCCPSSPMKTVLQYTCEALYETEAAHMR